MALDLAVKLQYQIFQSPVITAKAKAVRQLDLPGRHIRIKFLQHPGQHPLAQQLRLPLVQNPEIRRQSPLVSQIQQVDVFPQQGGTESINGFDIRLINQQLLTLEVPVSRLRRHTVPQLLGDPLAQLGSGGAGIGDNKEIVQVCLFLPQYPPEQTFHQDAGLAAAGGGGYQHPSALIFYNGPLAVGQLDPHAEPSPPTITSICPQNSSGLIGRSGSRWSLPSPSAKLQAEAKAQ